MTEARRCIKCGREIGPEETICEVCNRAGMATPSATQYHATVVAAIVVAVVGLAAWASLSLRGVGPFGADVAAVEQAGTTAYAVTFRVTNEGTREGRAKCRVLALGSTGQRLRAHNVLTGPIAGGATLEVIEPVSGLDERPAEVVVSCS